jgi:ATP-dependent DNA ligase
VATHAIPVTAPLAPMLGRRVDELPEGDWVYEPKWDGFRCVAFRSGGEIDLRSRHDRPLTRYFPELVTGLAELSASRFVLDGEIVVPGPGGLHFDALLARVHPAASRVDRLRRETPARFVAFDVVALDGQDLRERPFSERRELLSALIGERSGTVRLTPATRDPAIAREWLASAGGGIDGVMAKAADLPYQPGRRAMLKVKQERTADCVVAGFRPYVDRPLLSSLLLGLYDDAGELRHFGIVQSFTQKRRRELLEELAPLRVPLGGHPWEHGFLTGGGATGRLAGAAGRWSPGEMALDWVPLAPTRVCEVAYDQLDDGRLRHPARFRRWRPDRVAPSCTLDQLSSAGGTGALELLSLG